MSTYTAEYLISEVSKVARTPFSEWKIGIGDVIDSEKHLNTAVFSPNNNEAVLAAYEYFTRLGMTAKEPTGNEMRYLYLFKIEGELFPIDLF